MIEIHQAGPVSFIRTLLYIILFYYIFKFLARLFAPYLMKKMMNKMKEKAEQQFKNHRQETQIKEGETIIDKKPKNAQKTNEDVGEYVDFEEID